MRDNCLFEKIYGSLAGFIIGDALGFPTEGLTPEEIKQGYGFVRDFVAPIPEHPNSYLPRGHVTDDTEEMVILANAIIKAHGRISRKAFADALINWAKEEDLASKTYIGPSTLSAINKLLHGVDPMESGDRHITCGAAMRIAPIGLIFPENPQRAAEVAADISLVTHGGKAALAAASAVASAISIALEEKVTLDKIINTTIINSHVGEKFGRNVVSPSVGKRIALAVDIAQRMSEEKALKEIYDVVGTGILSTEAVPAAFGIFVITKGDPMKSIVLAANIGGDTDTIGAIAGALSGAYNGIKHIDFKKLKFVEQVNNISIEKIAKKLFEVVAHND